MPCFSLHINSDLCTTWLETRVNVKGLYCIVTDNLRNAGAWFIRSTLNSSLVIGSYQLIPQSDLLRNNHKLLRHGFLNLSVFIGGNWCLRFVSYNTYI